MQRTTRTSPRTRLLLYLLILLVGVPAILAFQRTLSVLVRANNLAEGMQAPWSFIFPIDHPEFKEQFAQSLLSANLPPFYPFKGTYAASFLGVIALLCLYRYVATREKVRSAAFFLPALAPALVGLALAPLIVDAMISALPVQGLSNPGAAGATVGVATKVVGVGVLLSLLSFLGMRWSKARVPGSEAQYLRS